MKSVQERAADALALMQPILKDNFVDLGSEPFIDIASGTLKSKLVWHSTAPKADEMPEAAPLPVTEDK